MQPTLVIKTKLDTTGVSSGIAKVKASFSTMGSKLKSLTSSLLSGITGAIIGLIALVLAFAKSILSKNDELNAKLQSIISVIKNIVGLLADMLAPVLEYIINLIYKIVSYIGTIIKKFSGKDVFKDSAKSLKSGAKSAQELKKVLSGIDELNILSDKSSGGTGGLGGLGNLIPDEEAVEKAEKMADNLLGVYNTSRKEFKKYLEETFNDYEVLWQLGLFDIGRGLEEFFMGIWRSLTGVWEILKGVFTGDLELAGTGVKDFFGGIWDSIKGLTQSIWGGIELWVSKMVEGITKGWEAMKIWWQLFLAGLWKGLKIWYDNKIKPIFNAVGSAFKGVVNFCIEGINRLINSVNMVSRPLKALLTSIGDATGVKINMPTINIPQIQKLAKGGIINIPGRGVPIGGAIAGENGMEGVIPLTDTAQMELLGETIGKYININATIPVYVGNRQIARELRQINEQDSFASNI